MDAMVSARVPVEVKKQADKKLREIGCTATDLINAAYRYVLEENALPASAASVKQGKTDRILAPEQLAAVRKFLESTTFAVPDGNFDGHSYDKIIADGRCADYEALA
jgi:antitoxin component of RelBE/YafQ-DinJ toxin-antitoxin module